MTDTQRPVVTTAEAKGTRAFSKRLVVGNLAITAGLAAYGLWSGNPDTAAIIGEYGMWSFAALSMYMAIGYGDHRLSKGAPSLADLATMVFSRGRVRSRFGDDYDGRAG